jgi:hypothetical protein
LGRQLCFHRKIKVNNKKYQEVKEMAKRHLKKDFNRENESFKNP